MSKKHIITIAGKLGSGKSSNSKNIATILGYEHASTGEFMRKMADEKGLKLDELSKIAETDDSVDIKIDDYTRALGQKNNIVIDSRLGFYFIPDSFKVFLELDPEIASERILEDKKTNTNRHAEASLFDTKEDIMNSIQSRLISEKTRYKKIYGIDDITAPGNFDLIIDTSNMSLEEVSQKIIEEYKNWLGQS